MKQTVQKIQTMSTFVHPSEKIIIIKDDPDDNVVLECALEGDVNYIISNDEHLLKLKEFRGIKIITPPEFRTIMR